MADLLSWLADNKDALIAIAALVSPVTAVPATFVSYRAVVTGPKTQLKIAGDQFAISSKQLALQERTVALTEAQMSASLLGAADQKSIEDLRETVAELEGLISERGVLMDVQNHPEVQNLPPDELVQRLDRITELGNRIDPLIAKIRLMVGPAGGELTRSARDWANAREAELRVGWGFKVFDLTWQIIEQKQEGITARLGASREGHREPVSLVTPARLTAAGRGE
jgi:hypothetical protein